MVTEKTFTAFRSAFVMALQSLWECAEKNGNPNEVDSLSKFYNYLCQRVFLAVDNPEFESEILLDDKKNIDALRKNPSLIPKKRCSGAINEIQNVFNEFKRGENVWAVEQNLLRNLFEDLFIKLTNGLLTIEFVEPILVEFNNSIAAQTN